MYSLGSQIKYSQILESLRHSQMHTHTDTQTLTCSQSHILRYTDFKMLTILTDTHRYSYMRDAHR